MRDPRPYWSSGHTREQNNKIHFYSRFEFEIEESNKLDHHNRHRNSFSSFRRRINVVHVRCILNVLFVHSFIRSDHHCAAHSIQVSVKFDTKKNRRSTQTTHKIIQISKCHWIFFLFIVIAAQNIENGPPILPTQNKRASRLGGLHRWLASFILLFIELWLFVAQRQTTNDTEHER